MSRSLALSVSAMLLLAMTFTAAAVGQEPNNGGATDAPAQVPASTAATDPDLASPRAALTHLIHRIEEDDKAGAAKSLDLSHMKSETADSKGPTLAYQLKEILDRLDKDFTKYVPDDPHYDKPYPLSTVLRRHDAAEHLVIAKGPDHHWRFTRATVEGIEDLLAEIEDKPKVAGLNGSKATVPFPVWLRSQFPESLRGKTFLLPDFQWICLFALILFGFIVDMVTRFVLRRLTHAWFRFFKNGQREEIDRGLWKPVGLLTQAGVWYFGTKLIGLPTTASDILLVGLKLFTVVAAVWTAFLLIDLLSKYLAVKAKLTDTKFDDLLIPMVSKSLKVFAVCMGAISAAGAFNLPITGLLGGLGIGGMALAFASKDAISNLFGSITVLVDRPFEVGDWVVAPDAEGSVETVGFRSTRIRTFYNSVITVPNSVLTTAVVDNMGRRRYRRIKTTLGVQYDTTPEQIDAFCEGIRELLRRHPYTRKDYYHVYFNQFSESSLDVLLYCFLECPDWSVELRERHRLFLDILRLAQSLGVGFAFPTSTLHMFSEQQQTVPPGVADPMLDGRRHAARIAGSTSGAEQRPGPVEFTGPSDLGSDDADEDG